MKYLIAVLLLIATPLLSLANNDSDNLMGSLRGYVYDAETNEPVSFVYIHLEEINRSVTSNRDGTFNIGNLPAGIFTISLHRLGYIEGSLRVEIQRGEDKEISIPLVKRALSGEAIEVVAERQLTGAHLGSVTVKMSGAELRRNLGSTVSETLSSKPGFDQRTMGAATSRPVIRGLGDERILILQDGERTGDVSATSADHSVTIDPITANEIEIARGPAALAYGSNAVGGVVNVVKNHIPTSIPSSISGTAILQGSTVNTGISAAGQLKIPFNNSVLNLDINGRGGGNYRSPSGTIGNSDYLTTNSSAAYSIIRPGGYSGLAFSTFISDYGIPPDPDGGHPNGVDIEMQRFQIENRNEFLLSDSFFRLVDTNLSYRYYNHKEFETSSIIGTEYITNTVNLSVNARHHDIGRFKNGRMGIWGEVRDYIVIDRANIETTGFSGSAFIIQELDTGPFHFEFGARLDANYVQPREERFSSLIGQIRSRSFVGLASSVSASYHLGGGWNLGTSLLHSFRPPSSEELYSQGPHIASYSFEIGNPELSPERALASELFLNYNRSNTNMRLSAYHHNFFNYIFPRDTGRESVPFPTLNEFQFEGVKAEIYGFEAETEFRLTRRFQANASAQYTIGNRDVTDLEREQSAIERTRDPLPMIPPVQATIGLTYTNSSFSLGGRLRHSLKQNRVAEFEEPTDGFTIIDLRSSYLFSSSSNKLHTVSLSVNNLLNTEYRNHLSRLKEVFPEPGISVNFLYRLYF